MSIPSSPLIRLVISDIDGTLLDDDGNLPEANRLALEHCKALGVKTCLATGRRWTTCSRLLDRLDLHGLIDYCILNNGMLIREVETGATLFKHDFPFDTVLDVIARLNASGLDPVVLGHNPDGKTRDVFHRHDSLMNADFIAKNTAHARQVEDWIELADAHLVELILIGTRSDLAAAAESLSALAVETALLKNSFYKEYMLEITPHGVSKWLGVRELLAHLELGEHEAMAIGDSDNDYPMLLNLPLSIAVANAEAKVKAVVREMTGGNSEGGFGQAVFRHLPPLS